MRESYVYVEMTRNVIFVSVWDYDCLAKNSQISVCDLLMRGVGRQRAPGRFSDPSDLTAAR